MPAPSLPSIQQRAHGSDPVTDDWSHLAWPPGEDPKQGGGSRRRPSLWDQLWSEGEAEGAGTGGRGEEGREKGGPGGGRVAGAAFEAKAPEGVHLGLQKGWEERWDVAGLERGSGGRREEGGRGTRAVRWCAVVTVVDSRFVPPLPSV